MNVYGATSGRHSRWIRFCIRKSYEHKVDNNYRHVACLVRGGRIIRHGANKTKAGRLVDPVYEYRQYHAELSVLCELDPEIIRGSILYIAGWSKGNHLLKSKPCRHCLEYLKRFDLKEVVYSLPDGSYEKLSV